VAINEEFAMSIVSTIANYLQIPKVDVTFVKLNNEYKEVAGYYIPGSNVICINSGAINNFNDLEFTALLIHEMRHAYQDFQIRNKNMSKEPKDLLAIWDEEMKNYKHPIHHNGDFIKQKIEIDAIAFTYFFLKKYLKQDLIIPNDIHEEVIKRVGKIEKTKNM